MSRLLHNCRFCLPCKVELQPLIKSGSISASPLQAPVPSQGENLLVLSDRDKDLLHEVKRIIEMHPVDESLSLKQLCRKVGLNEFKLKKGFRQLFSFTPYSYFLELKMLEAKKLLREPGATVNGVAYTLGYHFVPNFCIQFKKRFGITAKKFMIMVVA